MRAGAVGEVEHLALERAAAVVGHGDLAAAGVVEPAREVDQRQVGGLAVLRAAIAVMAAGADLADHRRRGPVALGAGDGERAVGREAQAVGVAEAGREDLERAAVGRDPQQSLLARGRVEVAPPRRAGGRR